MFVTVYRLEVGEKRKKKRGTGSLAAKTETFETWGVVGGQTHGFRKIQQLFFLYPFLSQLCLIQTDILWLVGSFHFFPNSLLTLYRSRHLLNSLKLYKPITRCIIDSTSTVDCVITAEHWDGGCPLYSHSIANHKRQILSPHTYLHFKFQYLGQL